MELQHSIHCGKGRGAEIRGKTKEEGMGIQEVRSPGASVKRMESMTSQASP